MQLHQLQPVHKKKERKRVGRGGVHGTYSGKGQKGQKARAGTKFQPAVRYLFKKCPKLRGYRYQRPYGKKKTAVLAKTKRGQKTDKPQETKLNTKKILNPKHQIPNNIR
ncbi:MAG: hypothetical protein COT34_02170 [Candidatus Nealsonbacteria bacterium CG08_land_8_20_14_0_20_43_11]|uniref:50S ribosomal protein L15 n=1 Tax=Candidatus Nealsonbacteria bacterium CG08_land_8_20_14_0_20_43_11 TaxID=1974706 RepID=A0A2M6T053_9BACT|nr:MAG: hypothetical protein COT34_02170 [Candidatus Nealsonbacteria bacterium CG08_land_8_20_14_0_20_43_11]